MTFTTIQRAKAIYSTTIEVFDWHKTSECVTPYELALKQFEGCDVAGTVCIPGAGVGTYVLAAIEVGFNPANIYAVEFDRGYYQLGAAIFDRFGINYVHADFLEWGPQMKFDVVVGNPPYSLPKGGNTLAQGGKNLAIKFIEKSVDLLTDGGYISMVTPYNFLKPVNSSRPSQRFKSMNGLSLRRVDTGTERAYFPNIKTKICVWDGVKSGSSDVVMLNGFEWDLSNIPFIVDLDPQELEVFQRLWKQLKSGSNPVQCKHIKDGNQLPEEGWSMTERVNRRYGKEFIVPWGPEPVREKYEQIHISLSPEKAKELFSQLHVRFFVKATNVEPTVYHHLFNGLDFGPVEVSKADQEVMTNYLNQP